jgi:hypothetical protein
MAATRSTDNEAFRRFLRRVWQHDINPLLRGEYALQRRTSARVGGKLAASAGLLVDGILGLRGRPFARFMAVLGSSFGALLPDVWDWSWLRNHAGQKQRKVVAEQVQRRAAELPVLEALAIFRLPPTASREELKDAWRAVSKRWHPDKAPDDPRRAEYHVRFVAYQAAYRRLCEAYEGGLLPRRS